MISGSMRISIHALREEGDLLAHGAPVSSHMISIHALREEGDLLAHGAPVSSHMISIHALREEGDSRGVCSASKGSDFYPRPPRGGRPL